MNRAEDQRPTSRHLSKFVAYTSHFVALAMLNLVSACGGESQIEEGISLGRTEEEFWSVALWDTADHEDITDVALSFMNSDVAGSLGDSNEYTDDEDSGYKMISKYHFDDCVFTEATQELHSTYRILVEQLNPSDFDDGGARDNFGRVLHAQQDFYSHSNWAEHQIQLGKAETMSLGDFLPRRLEPGEFVGGDMLVLQQDMPNDLVLLTEVSAQDKVPAVGRTVGGMADFAGFGLITGTYADNDGEPLCIMGASIPHGDEFYDEDDEPRLAKDDGDAPNHTFAKQLARDQTREEFCRLSRLLMLRYGQSGRTTLNAAWGISSGEYDDVCPTSVSKVVALVVSGLG